MLKESSKGGAKKPTEALFASADSMSCSSLFVSKPQKTTSWTISMTIHFPSREEAEDFVEDRNLLKEPAVAESFKRATEESTQKKARPIEELYKKYGV